MTSKMN